MAAKTLGKARPKFVSGLGNVDIPAPVYDYDRIQFNGDGTLTVVVGFYRDQAAFDAKESPYEVFSYQVNEPAALDNLLNTELKTLPDFDAAP